MPRAQGAIFIADFTLRSTNNDDANTLKRRYARTSLLWRGSHYYNVGATYLSFPHLGQGLGKSIASPTPDPDSKIPELWLAVMSSVAVQGISKSSPYPNAA